MNIQEQPVGGYEVVKLSGRWLIIRPILNAARQIMNIELVGDEGGLVTWGRRCDAVRSTYRLAYRDVLDRDTRTHARNNANGGGGQAPRQMIESAAAS